MKRPLLILAAVLLFAGFGCAKKDRPAAEGAVGNASFMIDGKAQPLKKGRLTIFGEPTYGDLDGDGDQDAAVLLMDQPGGSGTFFYVAALFNENGGYRGSNAILLGDRIAPQDTAVSNGMIVANYAERAPGEPFTTQPSVGVSKYVRVENGALSAIPKP